MGINDPMGDLSRDPLANQDDDDTLDQQTRSASGGNRMKNQQPTGGKFGDQQYDEDVDQDVNDDNIDRL